MHTVDIDTLVQPCASGGSDSPLLWVNLDDADWDRAAHYRTAVRAVRRRVLIGLASGPLPAEAAPVLESFTTTVAPAGPGTAWAPADEAVLKRISERASAAPGAALILKELLDLASQLDVESALTAESLAYSVLLGGPEFAAWRTATPRTMARVCEQPVLAERDGPVLRLVLNNPGRHNAFSFATRDALIEALEVALVDDSVEWVELSATGRSFCSGGDLSEFGTAPDVVTAHLVRTQQSAGAAVHAIRDRVRVVMQGACIGAGIEVPAFASHITARPDAWFCLPELDLGLIPGAGGTVSVSRRIGRWRTAFMVLSGTRIGAATAADWGLVDTIA